MPLRSIRPSLCLAAAGLTLGLLVSGAEAAPIPPSGVSVVPVVSSATVTTGNLALATDGDTSTGFLATATLPGGVSGIDVIFTFDVSAFTTVTGFTLSAQLVSQSARDFEAVLLGWACCSSANGFDSFVSFRTPNGVLTPVSITVTAAGSGDAAQLSRYLSGSRLTVGFYTDLFDGTGQPIPISLDFREIVMEVQGTLAPTSVPLPGSLPVFATLLGLGLIARRVRTR
ncbi:MAG: hypothetical protein MUC64_10410 [Rubritepida sp.]|nr:hypothetical protein [Rubritepida sp.]